MHVHELAAIGACDGWGNKREVAREHQHVDVVFAQQGEQRIAVLRVRQHGARDAAFDGARECGASGLVRYHQHDFPGCHLAACALEVMHGNEV